MSSSRKVITLTQAQQHWLEMAIRNYVEVPGGCGWDDASTRRIQTHFDNIRRQMGGDYTNQERIAIYDFAVSLAGRAALKGGSHDDK